jgi:DNA-binding MarR family transcriptional regulator
MTNDLREELRQQKPFGSLEQEAYLSIGRTQAELSDAFELALRPFGISPTQYNVLHILRGAGPDGLCRNEIRDRLLSRMPDVTRLLDRMEDAGLVTRVRSDADRRLVSTRLTDRGRELVDQLDQPVAEEHERRLGHLSEEQLRTLIELLALARTRG